MTARVSVVGAGVAGLTCAVHLAEDGVDVAVLARDLPLETSSAAGGGLCLPSTPSRRTDAEQRWADRTRQVLSDLSTDATSGVAVRPGVLLGGASLPPGWPDRLPLVDLDRYLPYLRRRLEDAGGSITRLGLAALPERGLVVNCSGAAARSLAADPTVQPVREQLLRLADPGLDRWWLDADPRSPCAVLPHGQHVVIAGARRERDWSRTPDPAEAAALHERAAAVVPALADAAVLGHRVAVQAARAPTGTAIRVERARGQDGGRTVVHCYGWGTDALALSWGYASEVRDAVRAAQPLPRVRGRR